jgi:hypothetical protein
MAGHLLVAQLRFARSEFARGLEGVTAVDGIVRLPPLNCLSWMVGHLAQPGEPLLGAAGPAQGHSTGPERLGRLR